MFNNILKNTVQLLCVSMICAGTTYAAEGGIALGATRLIYEQDKKQASMSVINSTTDKRYLINSWMEDANDKKTTSIIVTPPMFVSEAKSENALRLLNTDNNLPLDRETLFYLNVQAIPSVNKKNLESDNVLQLAILSRIKVMIRPAKLTMNVDSAPNKIEAQATSQGILVKNPTPYYMTLVETEVAGKKSENFMIKPYADHEIKTKGSSFSFQTINDYGAFTQKITLNLK